MSLPAIAGELAAESRTAPAALVDGVVFQRYEYKYAIPPALVRPISEFVCPYCELDRYAAREPERFYTISSLYLDTPGMKTYWDKEAEVPHRFKLRVRTYGRHAEGPVKFEIKRRFNEVSRKTWVEVPRDIWPALLLLPGAGGESGLYGSRRAALDDFLNLTRRIAATPKMLVRYERQAYVSRVDRYVRISFDRRICGQPCAGYQLHGAPGRWRHCDGADGTGEREPRVILEIKFMTSAPVWLVDMVRTFGLIRRGFSKYCSAVALTGGVGRDGPSRQVAASWARPARGR